jgi:hypothetical protein
VPYITPEARDAIRNGQRGPWSAGELNYALTCVLVYWLRTNGGLSYTNINAAVGALECAKLELYRRLAAPYENAKQAENGDVYDLGS